MKNSGSVMWCVKSIAAVNASTTARTASQASITARRGSRSATTPPARVKTTRVSVNAASTPPRAVAERLTESTANASATGMSASPAPEATWPSQSNRNWRSRSGWTAPPSPTGAP